MEPTAPVDTQDKMVEPPPPYVQHAQLPQPPPAMQQPIVQQPPPPQIVYVQQPAAQSAQPVCKFCRGPITYERDMFNLVCLIICCGLCALCCLPKREAVCVRCGKKQGYHLEN